MRASGEKGEEREGRGTGGGRRGERGMVRRDRRKIRGGLTLQIHFLTSRSYDINWGDGTSEMGLSHRLTNVAVSKSYNTTLVPANAAVDIYYCNSPLLQSNKCCDHATFFH